MASPGAPEVRSVPVICMCLTVPPFPYSRYYKDDLPTKKAQEMLKKISNSAYSSSEKARRLLAAFLEIRARCRPVMRFFFRERHKDPMAWFAMRLNYARSAATTSIVGYVLGLGDRHISNILIDKITGELVHIDLGIAFEQVRRSCCMTLGYSVDESDQGDAFANSGDRTVSTDSRYGGRAGHDGSRGRIQAVRGAHAARAQRWSTLR